MAWTTLLETLPRAALLAGVRIVEETPPNSRGEAVMLLEVQPGSPYAAEAVLEGLAYLRHRFPGLLIPWPDQVALRVWRDHV